MTREAAEQTLTILNAAERILNQKSSVPDAELLTEREKEILRRPDLAEEERRKKWMGSDYGSWRCAMDYLLAPSTKQKEK